MQNLTALRRIRTYMIWVWWGMIRAPIRHHLIKYWSRKESDLITQLTLGFPPVLNPPFAICQDGKTGDTESLNDDIAIYNVRGNAKDVSSLDGDDLSIQINVDLNLRPDDKAKINDNNNQYIRVNLVADEDKDSAHKIPFTVNDLWTDCKNVALNSAPLFEPIQSEIPP